MSATNTTTGTLTSLNQTNLNTTGATVNTFGNASTVSNTITGATNSIQGNINDFGVRGANGSNTFATVNNIGNAFSTNNIQGTTTNIGTTGGGVAGTANTINIGQAASAGGSNINFNGNRLQGVAAGINGTDAVNMNQYNALQNSMNTNINNLKYGVAGVAAASNIPGLNKDQDFNIGMGVGGYQGYGAMAIGANVRIYENITVKASGSTGGGQTSGGLGLSFGW